MARNKQILIHYHTSTGNVETVKSEIRMGEIVVKHATATPELYIKNDNNEIVTFIDSKAIEHKLSVLKTDLEGQITAADGSAVSALTDFKAEVAETYATKEGVRDDIATAKDAAIGAASAYTDTKVKATADELSGEITGVDGRVTALNNSFTAYQGTVASTYATKEKVADDIAAAKDAAIGTASAYTDTQVNAAEGRVNTKITGVDSKVTTLNNSFTAYQGTVASTYATKDKVADDIATAKDAAIGTASAYTDTQVSAAEGRVNTKITGVDSKVTTLVGSDADKSVRTIAADEVAKGVAAVVSGAPEAFDTLKEIADWINAGSGATTAEIVTDINNLKKADEALSSGITKVDGRVTTLNDSFTAYQGTVASTYATKEKVADDIATAKSEAITSAESYTDTQVESAATALSGEITKVDGRVTTLTQTVANNKTAVDTKFNDYYTSAQTDNKISTAKSEAITSAESYTDTQVESAATALSGEITKVDGRVTTLNDSFTAYQGTVASTYATKEKVADDIAAAKDAAIGTASAYTDTQVSAAEGRVNTKITGLDSRIDTLEGLSATTQSAIQTITVDNTETHKITATKTGTSVALNFDEMIIDCGEF